MPLAAVAFEPGSRTFHLHNGLVSYVLRVLENGTLGHLYFGLGLDSSASYAHLSGPEFAGFGNRLDEPVALEYPTAGIGDFRVPALAVEQADGSTTLDLRYAGHEIHAGKPPIAGLPATYAEAPDEAATLGIVLSDEAAALEVRLLYTIFRDRPVVARSARVRNVGRSRAIVRCAMSASLDLPDARWQLLQLSGGWARERHVVGTPLRPGRQCLSSSRGASGHEHNPFVALRRAATTEAHGEALAASLVYSGNFLAEIEVAMFGTARLRIGIDPDGFGWTLEPGGELATPEAVLAYSAEGLGGLSDAYHGLYRERLARGPWRDRPRPIVLNSWEATYFDFDEPRLLAIAAAARDLGVELFVLDDGWFGTREADTSSLGDWFPNRARLPDGVDGLARRVEALGLGFGLWIEPEMVSVRSRLYAEHPDWAIGAPGRPSTESRNQLVLDLGRPEVVDHLYGVVSGILAAAPISYLKWDMNRNITEPYGRTLSADRQGEFFHRYMLGVYELYERLTAAFPDVLFESCAGGGGRFDAGLLAYAPQAWTSDDTDAVERLRIQWATSLVYPLSSMVAHVSAVPNHQVGRVTPLATRAAVAFFGVLGYELDPTVLSEAERLEVAAQIAWYKERRELLQRGRFVRLRSPFVAGASGGAALAGAGEGEGEGDEAAWLVVSADRRHAIAGHYTILNRPFPGPGRLRLRGLDPSLRYSVTSWPPRGDRVERANAGLRGGDELMQVGLLIRPESPRETGAGGDFTARLFELEAT